MYFTIIKKNSYIYFGEGGFSSAIPYAAGLSALAWDINPDLTIDEIIRILVDTKTTTSQNRNIINPIKFIDEIKAASIDD